MSINKSKTNSGLTGIQKELFKYSQKPVVKKKKVFRWQELGDQIVKELKASAQDRNLIFKICYEHPEAYVEHCFNETKELAKGDKATHYFVKLIYKKKSGQYPGR